MVWRALITQNGVHCVQQLCAVWEQWKRIYPNFALGMATNLPQLFNNVEHISQLQAQRAHQAQPERMRAAAAERLRVEQAAVENLTSELMNIDNTATREQLKTFAMFMLQVMRDIELEGVVPRQASYWRNVLTWCGVPSSHRTACSTSNSWVRCGSSGKQCIPASL